MPLRALSISQVVYTVPGLWYNDTVGTVMAQVGRLGLLSYIQSREEGRLRHGGEVKEEASNG